MAARRNWTPARLTTPGLTGPVRVTREEAEKREREFDAAGRLKEMLRVQAGAAELLDVILAGRQELVETVQFLTALEKTRRRERDEAVDRAELYENGYEGAQNDIRELEEQVDEFDDRLQAANEEARTLREENTMLRVQLAQEQPNVDSRMIK